MASNYQIKVRSLKGGDWYWIERKVIKYYGKNIGPSGIAVYNALASFADSRTQCCFPTRKRIALILGLSRRTVTRKINLLKELRLISVEKVGISYRYYLLKLSNEETNKASDTDKNNTSQSTLWSTYNNKILRIKNNSRKPVSKNFETFNPKSREELLAYDLAREFNDCQNLNTYLFYANNYPEVILRRTLGEVKEIPDDKIKKGRAALFHSIIKKHAQKTT